MKRRIAFALLALLAGGSFLLVERMRESASVASSSDPERNADLFMEGFSRTELDAQGRPVRELRAASMRHYPDDDVSEFVDPTLLLFRGDAPAWSVRAERGRSRGGAREITLEGAVRIASEGERGARFSAERLTLYPERGEAATDRPVVVETARSRTTAVGAQFRLNDATIELLSAIRSRYDPR